jgi:hypothetical protein
VKIVARRVRKPLEWTPATPQYFAGVARTTPKSSGRNTWTIYQHKAARIAEEDACALILLYSETYEVWSEDA